MRRPGAVDQAEQPEVAGGASALRPSVMASRVPYASVMSGQPVMPEVNRSALTVSEESLVSTQAPGGISRSAWAARLAEVCRRWISAQAIIASSGVDSSNSR